MRTILGAFVVNVFVPVVLEAIADSTAVIGSKSALSLGSVTLAVRPFLFCIGAALIAALFLLFSSPVLASELSDYSSSSDKSQLVLVSTNISSGKGCIVMVGLDAQSTTLLAQRSGWRRILVLSSWLHGIPPFWEEKGCRGFVSSSLRIARILLIPLDFV